MKVKFNSGDEILEVTIRDASMGKIETRRCNKSDAQDCGEILLWLINKWGVRFKVNKTFFNLDSEFLSIS